MTTFKRKICRNLAFLLRLRQISMNFAQNSYRKSYLLVVEMYEKSIGCVCFSCIFPICIPFIPNIRPLSGAFFLILQTK